MSNTVLFAGAGASKPFGYPLMQEFFASDTDLSTSLGSCWSLFAAVARKLHSRAGVSGSSGDEQPLASLTAPLASPLASMEDNYATMDVEDVLSLLGPIQDFLKTESGMFLSHYISEDYAQRIPELIQLIQHRCFEAYGQLADYQVAENTYIKLLNSLDWRSSLVSLFTTNYDPVTDSLMEYAENFSVPVYDGFRFISGKWDPARYSEVTTGLAIYRLRGSLSWIREGEKIRNTRFYGETKDREHILIYPRRSTAPQPMEDCIGYPHEALADKLRSAKNLIVIGYSFRDSFVNEILRTAMHRNADLKIVVVDPERPEKIDAELKTGDLSETERIIHVDTSFEQAVSDRSFRELIAPVKVFRAGEYPEDA